MPQIALTVSSTNNITGYLTWTESAVNIANNTSLVSVTMTFVCKGAYTTSYSSSNFYVEIDGTRFSYTGAFSIGPNETKNVPFASTPSKTITHGADGSKTIVISGGGGMPATTGLKSSSGSATVTLTTIPRASTIGTVGNGTIGTSLSVPITRPTGSTFVHRLSWAFGSKSGTINSTSTTATSISFGTGNTVANLAGEIPNSASGTLTLTLRTYTDTTWATQVGDASTKTVTMTLPTSVIPAVSLSCADTVTANDTGLFIQGITKPRFMAAITNQYGATTGNVSFTFNGVTLTGTANNQTFPLITTSGSLSCSCTVTDSRGRQTTVTLTITVTAYTPPKITSASIKRDPASPTSVTVTVSASASSLMNGTEKNTMTVWAMYSTTTPSNTYKVTTSGLSAVGATKTYTLSATQSFPFRIQVSDKFKTTYQDYTLSTADVIMDIRTNGTVGIGKYRERGALDVDGMIVGSNTLELGTDTSTSDLYARVTTTSGAIALESVGNASGNGNRGVWLGEHGTTSGHWLIRESSSGAVVMAGDKMPLYGLQTYLESAGSTSIALEGGGSAYLVVIARINSTVTTYQGLYLAVTHTNSVIVPIKESSAATLSISTNTLTVTTSQNYVRVFVIHLPVGATSM